MEPLEDGDPQQVAGYRLLALLGTGGMGRVYLARSRGGRRVALKVVRTELADDPEFVVRFRREVEMARTVGGAFTVSVIDADPLGKPPWLATEYVPGPSLAGAVRDFGPLPAPSLRALAGGLAESVAVIHSAGVVHRDLKPSNVLLALDGPRVIDFGISRAAEGTDLTRTGLTVGSPGYMSPEQIAGERVTGATDMFSLGAVLAFAAAGSGPFGDGPTPALLYRVIHQQPRLDGLPAELRPMVAACLAKDPASRPTPEALLDLLQETDGGGPVTGDWLPAGLTEAIERSARTMPGGPVTNGVPAGDDSSSPHSTPAGFGPAPDLGAPPMPASVPASPYGPATPVLGPVAPVPEPTGGGRRRGRMIAAAVGVVVAVGLAAGILAAVNSGGSKDDGANGSPSASSQDSSKPTSTASGSTAPVAVPVPTWSRAVGGPVDSSPTVVGGVLYVGCDDGKVYALDAKSGKVRWSRFAGAKIVSSPAVANGTVYVGSYDHKVYALDAATGAVRWTLTTGSAVASSPAVADGTVYVGSEDNSFYAIDAASGSVRWKLLTGDNVDSSPVIADGTLYVGSNDHKLYALDPATGKVRWTYTAGDHIDSSPTVVAGVVYVGSDDSHVHAVDAKTGKGLWSHEIGVHVDSTPFVTDGTVYVGSNGPAAYALDAATGAERWKSTTGDEVLSSPAVLRGTVYIGANDGELYALDGASGSVRWAFSTGGPVRSSPALTDTMLYVGSRDGHVYAFPIGS
ncbi:PQQ-binding-like beta-propeller repeat protein [Actinacidiphila alni]|uniref:outer membrane protein assembly factor BamB family protein n=1 Tax=Actinacidiphila alni TaxID=380248 RepID=UPI0033FBDEC3